MTPDETANTDSAYQDGPASASSVADQDRYDDMFTRSPNN